MKNILNKFNVLIFTLVFSLSIITAITYSFYTDSDTVDNKMELGFSKAEIEEDFTGTKKVVCAKNTGTTPLLIRANSKMICTKGEVVLDANNIADANYNISPKGANDTTYWIDGKDGWYYYNKLLPSGNMSDLNDKYYSTLETDTTLTEELVVIEVNTEKKLPKGEEDFYDGAKLDVPVNLEYYFPLKDGDIYTHEDAWNITDSSPVYSILRELVDNK